jgi:hypothetical protein
MVDAVVRISGLKRDTVGNVIPDVFASAQVGDLQLVKDHVLVDAGCVSKKFK